MAQRWCAEPGAEERVQVKHPLTDPPTLTNAASPTPIRPRPFPPPFHTCNSITPLSR